MGVVAGGMAQGFAQGQELVRRHEQQKQENELQRRMLKLREDTFKLESQKMQSALSGQESLANYFQNMTTPTGVSPEESQAAVAPTGLPTPGRVGMSPEIQAMQTPPPTQIPHPLGGLAASLIRMGQPAEAFGIMGMQPYPPTVVPPGGAAIGRGGDVLYQNPNQRMGALSTEDAKLGQALAIDLGRPATPQEFLDAKQKRDIEKNKAFGQGRAEAYGNIREYSVLDTKQGNMPVMVPANELNRANAAEPGRYITAGTGAQALNKSALIEDIRGGINRVRTSLEALPAFNASQRAQLAFILRDRDPRSAMSAFLASAAGTTMSNEQQQYVTDLTVLAENAMAMRSVLGAGQGSDMLRSAILATIPSAGTPNKAMAQKQLDAFEGVLNRLARGVPTVPLKPEQFQTPNKPKILRIIPLEPGK